MGWGVFSAVFFTRTSSGAMAHGEYYNGYWLSENGAWTYHNIAVWRQNDIGRWYGDDTGWYAKDQTLRVDGIEYTFDAEGYLK